MMQVAESVAGNCVLCGEPTITQRTDPPKHFRGIWCWEVRHEATGSQFCAARSDGAGDA